MSKPNFDVYVITTWKLFERLQAYSTAVGSDLLAFDVETNGTSEKLSKLWGIGLAFTANKAFYIPWRNPDSSNYWESNQEHQIKKWLINTLASKKIIGHNIIFDTLVLENNLGITIDENIYADTILMRHTLNEEGPFALKEISCEILGSWADLAQEKLRDEVVAAGGKWVKEQKDMYLASTETLGEYCCWDVILTMMLFEQFDSKIKEEGLEDLFYNDEVMPLYKEVTINMKRQGFPIDLEYYQNLSQEITSAIETLEADIMKSIKKDIGDFETQILNEEFPVKNTGNFPKVLAEILGVPLPQTKDGKITLAKKALDKQRAVTPIFSSFYDWLENGEDINKVLPKSAAVEVLYNNPIRAAQEKLFFNKNSDRKYIFNLKSNDHLAHLLCDIWGYVPLERTEKENKPKIDDDFLETIKGTKEIDMLVSYKKLNKLLSTYVEGIIERQIDGVIYTSMLQFGTTSGRFASRNPNLNNLPAAKKEKTIVHKYTNAIRKGFVAKPGYKIIGCDFNALEPRIASYVSQDPGLMSIFSKGEDFYSAIGIKQFNIKDATPIKDESEHSFAVKYAELRDKVKTYALAAFYGAEAPKISQILNSSYNEARELLEGYFRAFPKIKTLINRSHYSAKNYGKVVTKLGRVRHLPEAKSIYTLYGDNILDYKWARKQGIEDVRRRYKNSLNNSVNFQIQGLAAQVLNRSLISMVREFKRNNLDAYPVLTIHDEVLVMCKEEQVEQAKTIIKNSMENTVSLDGVGLKAKPIVGNSYGECK